MKNASSHRFEITVSRSAVLSAFAVRRSMRDAALYVLEQSDDVRLGRMIFDDGTDWGVALALQSFFKAAKAQWGRVPSTFTVAIEPKKSATSVVTVDVRCKGGAVASFA